MFISKVKTAVKVADVVRNTGANQSEIKFDYKDYCPPDVLNSPNPRVYLLTTDGVIRKIGYSEQKNGIRGTLATYAGGLGGSPSITRFGIHKLLSKAVKDGSKVEVWMIAYGDIVVGDIKGLFGVKRSAEIKISGKSLEDLCMADYLSVEKIRPDWNIQENNDRDWPKRIKDAWKKWNARRR